MDYYAMWILKKVYNFFPYLFIVICGSIKHQTVFEYFIAFVLFSKVSGDFVFLGPFFIFSFIFLTFLHSVQVSFK